LLATDVDTGGRSIGIGVGMEVVDRPTRFFLLNHRPPARQGHSGIHPSRQCHTSREIERVAIADGDPIVYPIDDKRFVEFPLRGPGGASDSAVVAVAGSIGYSRAAAIIEAVGSD